MIIPERCWPAYVVEAGAVDTDALGRNLDGNLAAVGVGDVFDSTRCYSQYWSSGRWDNKRILALQWRVRAQGTGTLAVQDRANGGTGWSDAGTIQVDSATLVDYVIDASPELMTAAVFDGSGVDGRFTCTAGTLQIDTAAAFLVFSTEGETSFAGGIGGYVEHASVATTQGASGAAFEGDSTTSGGWYPAGETITVAEMNDRMQDAASGAGYSPGPASVPVSDSTDISGTAAVTASYNGVGTPPSSGSPWINGSTSYGDAYVTIDDPNVVFTYDTVGVAGYATDITEGVDWIYDPAYFCGEAAGAGKLDGPPSSSGYEFPVTANFVPWIPVDGATPDGWSIGYEPVNATITTGYDETTGRSMATITPPPSFVGQNTGAVFMSGSDTTDPASGTLSLPPGAGVYAVRARTAQMTGGIVTGVNGDSVLFGIGSNNKISAHIGTGSATVQSGPFQYWRPASPGQTVRPPLRQRQRSDGLAASGAPRQHQRSTLQTSNRQRAVR